MFIPKCAATLVSYLARPQVGAMRVFPVGFMPFQYGGNSFQLGMIVKVHLSNPRKHISAELFSVLQVFIGLSRVFRFQFKSDILSALLYRLISS